MSLHPLGRTRVLMQTQTESGQVSPRAKVNGWHITVAEWKYLSELSVFLSNIDTFKQMEDFQQNTLISIGEYSLT